MRFEILNAARVSLTATLSGELVAVRDHYVRIKSGVLTFFCSFVNPNSLLGFACLLRQLVSQPRQACNSFRAVDRGHDPCHVQFPKGYVRDPHDTHCNWNEDDLVASGESCVVSCRDNPHITAMLTCHDGMFSDTDLEGNTIHELPHCSAGPRLFAAPRAEIGGLQGRTRTRLVRVERLVLDLLGHSNRNCSLGAERDSSARHSSPFWRASRCGGH